MSKSSNGSISSSSEFKATERPELSSVPSVFFVTSWGYAADHLFGWFPKVLNLHPEIFALLAHEGSRPKYFRERTRSERPPVPEYVNFLTDMGMTYQAIGDCYSYRPMQLENFIETGVLSAVPILNLTRHPIIWLEYFVDWRQGNMRMPGTGSDPLEWEWKITPHRWFQSLGLKEYSKGDVNIWAAFLGMSHLNGMKAGRVDGVAQARIEDLFSDLGKLNDIVSYISSGRAALDRTALSVADDMKYTLFRGETVLHTDAEGLRNRWADWQCDAFRKLVSREAMQYFCDIGYDLYDLGAPHLFSGSDIVQKERPRDLFVSSVFKSGTWMLRSILSEITGRSYHEPTIVPGEVPPRMDDETVIEFPEGTFFSWHMTISPRVESLLNSQRCAKIMLVRNIYSVLASAVHHLMNDIDAGIGRSVKAQKGKTETSIDFENLSISDSTSLTIAGFNAPEMRWNGLAQQIIQMASMLRYAAAHRDVMLISYEQLVHNKQHTVSRLCKYLKKDSEAVLKAAIRSSDPVVMRRNPEYRLAQEHILSAEVSACRKAIKQHHIAMVGLLLAQHFPDHAEVCRKVGMPWLFSPDSLKEGWKPDTSEELNFIAGDD